MGPIFVLLVCKPEAIKNFYFYLASATALIWLLFTLCFSEETNIDPSYYATNLANGG